MFVYLCNGVYVVVVAVVCVFVCVCDMVCKLCVMVSQLVTLGSKSGGKTKFPHSADTTFSALCLR